MAKKKKDAVAKVAGPTIIYLWADNPTSDDILSIEGILNVWLGDTPCMIEIDARYNVDEVAVELETLLSAKVPEAFYDEDTSPD